MTLAIDEAVLRRVVGAETLARGRRYARDGAVLSAEWDEAEGRVYGRVRGTRAQPYTAIALLGSTPGGALRSFAGTCTCPVGTNCKHSVALALVGQPEVATPGWEQRLAGLTDSASAPSHGDARVALQFDLAPGGPSRTAAALWLRPVVPGRGGGWVRTGISWSNLHAHSYPMYGRRALPVRQLQLLHELRALDSVAATYYGTTATAIDLATFPSRRVWDLLVEAADLGIPLVQPGKRGAAVHLSRDPVEVVVDVADDDDALSLRPVLVARDGSLVVDDLHVLGSPGHGAAWRIGDLLHIAALSTELDPVVRDLVRAESLRIPSGDAERFFTSFYPQLRRRVQLTSSDSSVVLPEPVRPRLVLTIRYDSAQELQLRWQWRHAVGTAAQDEPLHPGPELEPESVADLRAVVEVLTPLPAACEQTTQGLRLAADCTVRGAAAIAFAETILPRLTDLGCLTIETVGTPVDYREVDGATEIAFESPDTREQDWFDLAVRVSIGGQELPFEQLFVALATGQTQLILADGRYLDLDRPELRRLADMIGESRALHDAPPRTVRVPRLQAALWDELADLGAVTGPAARWQHTVRALADVTQLDDVAVPSTLRAQLRPYQLDGLRWLAFLYRHRLGGILADDMGLGKTVQTLAMICAAQEATTTPFLIVAPTSVMSNWAAECARFAPGLRVRTITETEARRGIELAEAVSGADVVVTSYTLFRLEFDAYDALDWAGLVLDEAQAVKNHLSRAYACARRLDTPFKLAITGTPMENHLGELWSLLSITAPGLFPTLSRFEEHFRRPIERSRDVGRLDQLRSRIRPVMLRRTKNEVAADLPDKQEQVLEVELNPRHRRAYQKLLHRERQKVLGLLDDLDGNRFEILRSLTLLRQASLDIALVDPVADVPATKLDVLTELLDDIVADGHRTLVFSQFTRFLHAARDRLDAAGVPYRYLDGTTRRRAAEIAAFKTGSAPVFLISLKAGGVGLNLTEADYCVLLDPWWNPATETQAIDRTHRIGQTRKVMVYRMVAKDTIEEKVAALKERKAALFADVLGDGSLSGGALTADDIRAMLS